MSETLTFKESVLKRPPMYFGSRDGNGIIYLLTEVIKNLVEIYEREKLTITVTIQKDESITLYLIAVVELKPVIEMFTIHPDDAATYMYNKIVPMVSDWVEISSSGVNLSYIKDCWQNTGEIKADVKELSLRFKPSKEIFTSTDVDYHLLCEKLAPFTLTYRKWEIITKDLRKKYAQQSFYHFPEGVFYFYERLKKGSIGTPLMEILYDGKIGDNNYQIAIAILNNWDSKPKVTSVANGLSTEGGAHVEGVFEGMVQGCKKYVKGHDLVHHKIINRKFINGLILVCSVKCKELSFAGCTKEVISNPEIKTETKKFVSDLVYNYLSEDKERASKFLERFNQQNFMHKMY